MSVQAVMGAHAGEFGAVASQGHDDGTGSMTALRRRPAQTDPGGPHRSGQRHRPRADGTPHAAGSRRHDEAADALAPANRGRDEGRRGPAAGADPQWRGRPVTPGGSPALADSAGRRLARCADADDERRDLDRSPYGVGQHRRALRFRTEAALAGAGSDDKAAGVARSGGLRRDRAREPLRRTTTLTGRSYWVRAASSPMPMLIEPKRLLADDHGNRQTGRPDSDNRRMARHQ